jgi:hypothetical protein
MRGVSPVQIVSTRLTSHRHDYEFPFIVHVLSSRLTAVFPPLRTKALFHRPALFDSVLDWLTQSSRGRFLRESLEKDFALVEDGRAESLEAEQWEPVDVSFVI